MRSIAMYSDLALASVIVVAVDVVAFHAGAYYPLVRPDSYSGRVEFQMERFESSRGSEVDAHGIVIMGDSTSASAMQEEVIEERLQAAGRKATVLNLSQGGSRTHSWYHLLKNSAVDEKTTRTVILGVHEPGLIKDDANNTDMATLKTRLRPWDGLLLARSYHELENGLAALVGAVYRQVLFKDDLLHFAHDPAARLAAVAAERDKQRDPFARRPRRSILSTHDLTSARLGSDGHLVEEGLSRVISETATLRTFLERVLTRVAERRVAPPKEVDPIQARMLERIVRLLNRRQIRVVVAVVPQTAFPAVKSQVTGLDQIVSRLQAGGADVVLYRNREVLEQLESPLYFRDMLHLNKPAADIFSEEIAEFLVPVL